MARLVIVRHAGIAYTELHLENKSRFGKVECSPT